MVAGADGTKRGRSERSSEASRCGRFGGFDRHLWSVSAMVELRGLADRWPPRRLGADRGICGRRRPVCGIHHTSPLSLLHKGELLLGFRSVGLSDVAGRLASADPADLRRRQLLRHPFHADFHPAVAAPPPAADFECAILCRVQRAVPCASRARGVLAAVHRVSPADFDGCRGGRSRWFGLLLQWPRLGNRPISAFRDADRRRRAAVSGGADPAAAGAGRDLFRDLSRHPRGCRVSLLRGTVLVDRAEPLPRSRLANAVGRDRLRGEPSESSPSRC